MDRLVSISALSSIIKSIPEKFKHRYEDKAELQKELASERIGNILSKTGIPGISDVGEEMT